MQVWLKFSTCRPGVVCHNKHWSTENVADAKRFMYEFECEGGDGKAIVVAAGSGAERRATQAVALNDSTNPDAASAVRKGASQIASDDHEAEL